MSAWKRGRQSLGTGINSFGFVDELKPPETWSCCIGWCGGSGYKHYRISIHRGLMLMLTPKTSQGLGHRKAGSNILNWPIGMKQTEETCFPGTTGPSPPRFWPCLRRGVVHVGKMKPCVEAKRAIKGCWIEQWCGVLGSTCLLIIVVYYR